jgi:hypothetical protein
VPGEVVAVLRAIAIGGLVALGLLAGASGAVGARSATGEEVQFAFTQAGVPVSRPRDLIETTMVGGGAFDLNREGFLTGAASGTIVYHESHAIGTDVELTFTVDQAATLGLAGGDGYLAKGRATVGFNLTVAKSNLQKSCPEEAQGRLYILQRPGLPTKIGLQICGRSYDWTAMPGPKSRIKLSFTTPTRCLLGMPGCPHCTCANTTTTTTATTTTPTAAAPLTEITVSDGTAIAGAYIVDSGTHKAGEVTCTGYVPTASSECWAFADVGKSVTVTVKLDGALAPGDTLRLLYDPGYSGDPNTKDCKNIDKGSGYCILTQTTSAISVQATVSLPPDKSQTHSTTAIGQLITPTGYVARALGIGLCDPSKGETAPKC